jgi:hypothetical protein
MMQKILNKLFSKLKSQKGATGADIVVALSIIVLTIGVISIIYVNLSFGSRKINRTAGATRIATNIIENINSLAYDDVNSTLSSFTEGTGKNVATDATKTTITINGKESGGTEKIFNTKIPKGYNLSLVVTNINDGTTPAYDLIKKVEVTVSFDVRSKTESVSLSSSKERETSKEVNSPNLTDTVLTSTGEVLPIKYSTIMGTYVPTTESDSEWYNYSNKVWAMVYVDTEDNVKSVKSEGKIDAVSLSDKVYYWIPRFSTESNGQALFGTTNYPITQIDLIGSDGSSILKVYSKDSSMATPYQYFNTNATTGVWVQKSDTSNETYVAFEATKFGPVQY